MVNISKTHYEIVRDLFKKDSLFGSINFDDFIKDTEALCGKNPTYDNFTKSPVLQQLALSSSEKDKIQVTVFANVLYHFYTMYQNHERIYYVCPKLAIDLAQTDLNVDTHFLKSPFPEMYIQIDPGLYYISDSTGTFPVRGFYVNIMEIGDTKIVRVMAAAMKTSYDKLSKDNDDSLFYFRIVLGPGKIKEQFQRYLEESVKANQKELKEFGGHYNTNHIQELFFFIFNVLLYITSKDADILKQLPIDVEGKAANLKNKAKIRKLLQRHSKITNMPVYIMGSKVTSEYGLDDIKASGGIGAWKLNKRVFVSGHWRNQWYGTGETKRIELIFIKPYEKGPEIAEVIERKYQVGKE